MKKFYAILIYIVVSVISMTAQTIDKTGNFTPGLTDSQIAYLEFTYADTDSDGIVDCAIALSKGPVVAYVDYSAAIAIYETGFKFRNGGSFPIEAIPVIPVKGQVYKMWVTFKVSASTYSVDYQTEGIASPVRLVTDYAFRKAGVTDIDTWSCFHNPAGEPDVVTMIKAGKVAKVGDVTTGISITLPSFTISASYNSQTSNFDKKKVLNVARGGQGISGNLMWLPKFNDKLVEIGVDEFRVDWLLSNRFYNVVNRSNGVLRYNFTYLDKNIIPMVTAGIKPLMCMTYMATPLGKDSDPPSNYDEYSATIRAYVQYYKDKGYTGWAWESHNEPEGFTSLTPTQTYTMYKAFCIAVKSVDPTARVGGFGAVGMDWISYIRSFLDLYKADTQKPPMDFFSFHQYGKAGWEYVPSIEYEFTSRGLTIPALYITEWNNHWGTAPGQGNDGISGAGNSFDTNVNAAYLAKKMYISYLYSNVKKIYCFNFADTDASKKFSGDMGLFTVDSYHRKASANTFMMFNRTYDKMLTTSVSGTNLFERNNWGFITVDKQTNKSSAIMWNYLSTKSVSNIVFTDLPQLPEGWAYHVDKYLIDSVHGNFYTDYKSGWVDNTKSPNEDIKIEKSYVFNSKAITITDTLEKYSVVQYLIEPKLLNTGVSNTVQNKNEFYVYPGIVESSAIIKFKLDKPAATKITVYDNVGRKMFVSDMYRNYFSGENQYVLDMKSWQAGLYFVFLNIDGINVNYKKVIKK